MHNTMRYIVRRNVIILNVYVNGKNMHRRWFGRSICSKIDKSNLFNLASRRLRSESILNTSALLFKDCASDVQILSLTSRATYISKRSLTTYFSLPVSIWLFSLKIQNCCVQSPTNISSIVFKVFNKFLVFFFGNTWSSELARLIRLIFSVRPLIKSFLLPFLPSTST